MVVMLYICIQLVEWLDILLCFLDFIRLVSVYIPHGDMGLFPPEVLLNGQVMRHRADMGIGADIMLLLVIVMRRDVLCNLLPGIQQCGIGEEKLRRGVLAVRIVLGTLSHSLGEGFEVIGFNNHLFPLIPISFGSACRIVSVVILFGPASHALAGDVVVGPDLFQLAECIDATVVLLNALTNLGWSRPDRWASPD